MSVLLVLPTCVCQLFLANLPRPAEYSKFCSLALVSFQWNLFLLSFSLQLVIAFFPLELLFCICSLHFFFSIGSSLSYKLQILGDLMNSHSSSFSIYISWLNFLLYSTLCPLNFDSSFSVISNVITGLFPFFSMYSAFRPDFSHFPSSSLWN